MIGLAPLLEPALSVPVLSDDGVHDFLGAQAERVSDQTVLRGGLADLESVLVLGNPAPVELVVGNLCAGVLAQFEDGGLVLGVDCVAIEIAELSVLTEHQDAVWLASHSRRVGVVGVAAAAGHGSEHGLASLEVGADDVREVLELGATVGVGVGVEVGVEVGHRIYLGSHEDFVMRLQCSTIGFVLENLHAA